MFAPQRSRAGGFEGLAPQTKDVVFCERSPFPLAVPSALVAGIWEQINEGLRAVPRGGAEVGGLLLGRTSQTGIVLAEEVVPIPIEYRFGPAFRLSDTDLQGIQSLMATVQKDPSKRVVGFYRSRTRNDSRSQESDSELLLVLEQAHTSFTSDFHYYIAFTPLSKMSMTASISVRKDDGWDDWQHMGLRLNPLSPSDPIEFETPPKASSTSAPALEQSPPRQPVTPPPPAPPEPQPVARAERPAYPESARALAHTEHRTLLNPDWMPAASPSPAPEPPLDRRIAPAWYIGGAIVLAVLGLGGYLRFSSSQPARVTLSEMPVDATAAASQAMATVRTGFSAAREGPVWRLTWDRAAVAALNSTGAVLAIRDGGKEQQVGLTPADLSSGTILYTPQTGDLLFTLNIVLPGNQLAEEHVRVLEGGRPTEASGEEGAKPAFRLLDHDRERPLRPVTKSANRQIDPGSAGSAPVDSAPASALASSTNQSPSSALPPATSGPAPVTVPAKAVRRFSPSFTGPIPQGASSDVRVRVQIDATGAVTKVTPVASNALNAPLVDAASRAAKFWVFEPAKADGQPVPSEMVLKFHFGDQ